MSLSVDFARRLPIAHTSSMRALVILALGVGLFACNSEATVCPNPAVCGQAQDAADGATDVDDAGSIADAASDAGE